MHLVETKVERGAIVVAAAVVEAERDSWKHLRELTERLLGLSEQENESLEGTKSGWRRYPVL